MFTHASVKPKGLKKGVTEKKWCQALGFKDVVGLSQTVGQLDFSATGRDDAVFLCLLFDIFVDGGQVKLFDKDGKPTGTYTREPKESVEEAS